MNIRPFGRTGLEISELVFGGGFVGGILILADEETRLAALRRAVAAGVNWIDTAAAYGDGASEETIGRCLPALSPRPHVSTKFRLAPDETGDIAGAVERSLERSLKRLRLDAVTLFQLHNRISGATPGALPVELVTGRGGVADALDRLKAQGLIRAAGFTALGDKAACISVVESGRFDSAQVYYNLLNPSAGWERAPAGWSAQDFSGLLAACERNGVAAMGIRALAAGVLASPRRHGREMVIAAGSELDAEAGRAQAVRTALGGRCGTAAQAALRFVLSNPDLSCAVVGFAEMDHLEQAIAATEAGPLPAEALRRLEPLWARDFR